MVNTIFKIFAGVIAVVVAAFRRWLTLAMLASWDVFKKWYRFPCLGLVSVVIREL